MAKRIGRVCVYCASSRRAHRDYVESAAGLGRLLARQHVTVVYGGGSVGSMGALANGALEEGGHVVGVLPQFMYDLEWGHRGLSELHVVNDLHERKRLMIEEVDAIVALPGGSGTFEELMEAITWKRLGLYLNAIVLVNVRGFFDRFVSMMEHCIAERFMDERHRAMWTVVDRVDDVFEAIESAPSWPADARSFSTP